MKNSLEDLTKNGWTPTWQYFDGCLILQNGSKRMLFEESTGEIGFEWDKNEKQIMKEKFLLCPTESSD